MAEDVYSSVKTKERWRHSTVHVPPGERERQTVDKKGGCDIGILCETKALSPF